MARKDIIKLLNNERKINKTDFLTQKEIKKALQNLGIIYCRETIQRNIKKCEDIGLVEIEDQCKLPKRYRLKEEHIF